MSILFRHIESLRAEERERLLRRSRTDIAALVEQVRSIVDGVRERGDEALRQYTFQFDKADLRNLSIQVSEKEIDAAADQLSGELRGAIEYAIENVRRFHENQRRPESEMTTVRPGILAGE
ncbi:MAG: histidinol dehydrogenase, partial [Spirochaetaceae bacterium]